MTSASRRQGLAWVAAAVLVTAWLQPAAARPRSQLEIFKVDTVDSKLDLMVRSDWEYYQIYGVDAQPREAQKYLLGQRIGGRATGSILHPRFWRWQLTLNMLFIEDLLRGELAGVQPTLDATPALNTDRLKIDAEYDVRTTFLAEHSYPITVFASRSTELVDRIFQSSYWLTTDARGATAAWNNDVFPLAVHYLYLENEGEQRELASGDEVHQVYATGGHEGTRSKIRLDYRMTDYHNRVFDSVDYVYHRGELEHALRLDAADRWDLSSKLRAQHRINTDRTFTETRLIEALTGRLTDDLRLRVRYELAWWRWDADDVLENVGWVELKHQLYKSLTTTVHGRVLHAFGDSGDRLEGTVAGAVVYRKRLGSPLIMTHGYQGLGTWGRVTVTGERFQVVDEPVTLSGEIPTRLAMPGVDHDSVEVADSAGARRYVRGRDFDLFDSGDVTYLRRLLGGDIPEGATVLVAYAYGTGGTGSIRDVEHRYTARLETSAWDWIKFYGEYGYRHLSREAPTGVGGATASQLTTHEARAGFEVSQWNLLTTAEYHLLTTERFTAHELSIASTAVLPISASFEPAFGVREIYVDIDALDEHKNALQVFTEARFPLGDQFSAGWRFNYTWELGGANDGHFLHGTARVEWRWRKLRLWLEYEARLAEKFYEAYGRHSITLNFRREL